MDGGVPLFLSDHIQGYARLEYMKFYPQVGGVLSYLSDHIEDQFCCV
jgi:hypothetical protein